MDLKNARMVWGSVMLCTMLWIGSCAPSEEYEAAPPSLPKEADMQDHSLTVPSPAAIPPIEAAAPQAFDTATFALG